MSNNIRPTIAAIGSVDNSKCIEEPLKTNINTSMDKIGTVDMHYADILRQLNQLIDANQIASISLQIVMKDGTIKTISSPEEQKKLLSQLVSTTTGN